MVERPLGEPNHLRTDADPSFVQGLDRNLVAFANLAKEVSTRDAALFKEQFARAARADAELVLFLAHREAGQSAFNEKRGDAAMAGIGIDGREHDEEIGFVRVRDPQLAAGEDPLVTISGTLARARGERERVAARPGLR